MKKLNFLLFLLLAIFLSSSLIVLTKKPQATPDQIIIQKNKKTLTLYKNNKRYEFPIGTGKNTGDKQKVGDMRTPLGKFKIIAIKNSSTWAYDFENDDKGPIIGAFGPWFLEFDGKWEGIAIHGTHDESTIGKNDSHGCIRLRNKDVSLLKELVTINFPVEVLE